jgi:autotransporter passenger strand-loop-strand repeat protein
MTTVGSGQTQNVSSGQTVSGTIVPSGGTEYIFSGGTADATALSDGVTDDFGVDSESTIFNGVAEYVYGGGSAQRTTISAGVQYVASDCSTVSTILASRLPPCGPHSRGRQQQQAHQAVCVSILAGGRTGKHLGRMG